MHGASIFAPAGAPADAIATLSLLVLAIAAAIFLVVAGPLAYCIVRYRLRPGDDDRDPPQVYGSNPVELAWTVVPLLITFVLITTRVAAHDLSEAASSAAPSPAATGGATPIRSEPRA